MFQAYAILAMIGGEDPREARDRAHRRALRDAKIASDNRRSVVDAILAFLAAHRTTTTRTATRQGVELAACCA
jgi:hypothetical protein